MWGGIKRYNNLVFGEFYGGYLSRRAKALLEVSLVSLVLVLTMWLFEAYLKWLTFWDWYFKVLLIFIALLAVIVPRRGLRTYGLLPRNPCFTLKWSALVVAVFVLPAATSIALSMSLGFGRGAGLSPPRVVLTVIWYLVFVGLAEEVYFRGYIQTRLEEVFGKCCRRFVFKAWRVNYGFGLIMSSAIFGIIHIATYWNPIIPRWEPTLWIPIHILGAFAFGYLAGALREASGDVYIPTALHGGLMAAYELLSTYTNVVILNITLFIAWFIFFYTMDSFFREASERCF